MNLLSKKFFGAGLVIGMVAFGSPAQAAMNFSNLPLWFEAGGGQADTGAQFIARGSDSEFLIAPAQAQFVLRKAGGQTATCTMSFVGADASATISGGAELAGKLNYLRGNDPARWQTGLPTFSQVSAEKIYPGVSVVYYGNQRQLEYDFTLAAGVNPNVIALRFDGAEKISVNPQGELVVSLNGGEMVQHQPVAYQTIRGLRQVVSAGYKILDAHTAAFSVGNFDRSQPLVIDPILSFSTYFGGLNTDIAHAIAVDANGFIYIAGETLSTLFTNVTPGTSTNFHGGTVTGDAFVAKFDNTGKTNLYFTYLGGSANEAALGLAVDNSGNAYVTGYTQSPDFPTTTNAFSGHIAGSVIPHLGYYPVDAFVAELNPAGSQLVYSTYLGGNASDVGNAITVDTHGNAYVAGYTASTNLPVTATALQPRLACTNYTLYYNFNAFVAEITPNGTNLNYCSYLGGTNYDQATGIALDPAGNIYVTGFTASTNFPTTNALAGFKFLNGATNSTTAFDAFVCKFQPNFSNLVYSTFLGGTNNDEATGIAADSSGNAYVVGWTVSTNFPYTNALASFGTNSPSVVHTNGTGLLLGTNAFLTQIKWNGTNACLGYSVMFGGAGVDVANGVALDAAGNVFVVGNASSTNFPVTPGNLLGSLRATNAGASDVFVTAFKADGSALLFSTYLGGALNDLGNAIAVDGAGNAYVAGQTFSTDFPAFNARQTALNGTSDAFLTRIMPQFSLPLTASHVGPNVLVSWPPTGQATTNFLGLQSNTNLLTTNWIFIAPLPVLTNGFNVYTFPPTNPAQFFRLHKL